MKIFRATRVLTADFSMLTSLYTTRVGRKNGQETPPWVSGDSKVELSTILSELVDVLVGREWDG